MRARDLRYPADGGLGGTAGTDVLLVWRHAIACRCAEQSPGSARFNVATAIETRLVGRTEAWRDFHAHAVLAELEADAARVRAAGQACAERLTAIRGVRSWARVAGRRLAGPGPWRARLRAALAVLRPAQRASQRDAWQCAAELCGRAGWILRRSGADTDEAIRRRLLAGTRHQLTLTARGTTPGAAAASTERLMAELRSLGGDDQAR